MRRCTILLINLGLFALGNQAYPQVSCLSPITCNSPTRDGKLRVAVRLSESGKPVRDRAVVFIPSSGEMDKATVSTDEQGVALAAWSGDAGADTLTITATADMSGSLSQVAFKFGPAPKPKYNLAIAEGDRQEWYQHRQLKDSLVFSFTPRLNTCRRTAVVFRTSAEGGSATPDTAWGVGDTICFVSTHWRLGDYVGIQRLQVTVLQNPQQHAEVSAISRATPWLGLGLAAFASKKLVSLNVQKGTRRVTRKTLSASGADSIEISYDSSVVVTRSVDTARTQVGLTPVAGVNWPFLLRWHWLRLFTGADLNHPTTNWFFGFSASQITGRWQHESVPFDVQLVLQLNRRDILTNPSQCSQDPKVCDVVTHTRIYGGGILFAYNIENALDKLVGVMLPK